jgi:hypothetical protein
MQLPGFTTGNKAQPLLSRSISGPAVVITNRFFRSRAMPTHQVILSNSPTTCGIVTQRHGTYQHWYTCFLCFIYFWRPFPFFLPIPFGGGEGVKLLSTVWPQIRQGNGTAPGVAGPLNFMFNVPIASPLLSCTRFNPLHTKSHAGSMPMFLLSLPPASALVYSCC